MAAAWCGREDPVVAFSTDGRTFEVADLGKLLGMDVAWIYWHEADPWGGDHFLVAEPDGAIHHVAIDPVARAVLNTTRLFSEPADVPHSVAPGYGDHFHGLAFGPDVGFAAWTRDKGLDYARILPLWSVPAPELAEAAEN